MKNTFISLSVCVIMSLFFSCQKDPGESIPKATDKVKTYTEDIAFSPTNHSITVFNLSYDAADRIVSFISASNPGDKFIFSYPAENTVVTEMYSGATLGIYYESYYRSGRIDSAFQYNDTRDTSTEKYIYDVSGNLAKTYEYVYSKTTGAVLENTITYTYDANGNVLKAEGTDTNVETFEYYADKIYLYPQIGPSQIPVTKRNLIKSHTVTSNGDLVGKADVSYTFDSNDRIATVTETTDTGIVVVKSFTYY